jgi:hypothetical protein
MAVQAKFRGMGKCTFETPRFSICGIRFPRKSSSLSLTGLMYDGALATSSVVRRTMAAQRTAAEQTRSEENAMKPKREEFEKFRLQQRSYDLDQSFECRPFFAQPAIRVSH